MAENLHRGSLSYIRQWYFTETCSVEVRKDGCTVVQFDGGDWPGLISESALEVFPETVMEFDAAEDVPSCVSFPPDQLIA